ncbi:MAG: hypothetical protein HYU66_09670 [Armatimonadetes bacterium]|nr:hypothetical protein [Armatimonadota bacterium]
MPDRDPIKVYDARWVADEFSAAEVTRLFEATLAYGRELGADTVTLTRDARLAAGHVLELAVDAALRLGFRVYLRPEPVSTPQSYFTALWVSRKHPGTLGLTVTASHNPAEYIGVKFTVPTVRAVGMDCGPAGGLTRVRELYHQPGEFTSRPGGALHLLDLTREYVEFSLARAGVAPGDLAGLKVVFDSFHGSAGPELYQALTLAGVEVEAHRLIPDGRFPTGSPNPTSQGKLDAAVARAREIGAQGQAAPPSALYDPKVSPLALAEWGKLGVRPVLFRNGHSQIKDYMRLLDASAAAEESGHYYHRMTLEPLTIYAENSALTILLFLGAVKADPGLMDRLCALQDEVFTTGEFNYQFEDDATRDAALEVVVKRFADEGAERVTHTPDGIDLQGTVLSRGVQLAPGRVALDEGWYSGYLRVATNEPAVVRSYFSAGDTIHGQRVEWDTRRILEDQFGGRVID